MANAKGLSLRGGQRPTWRPEREARGSALGVQSRSSRLHRGKVTGEIATAFPRLPRRFAPRNDTSGGYCGAPAPSSGLIPLCKALNERRYRRNRSVRFYRHLVRTGSAFPRLPRRFAPRNDTSGQRSNGNGAAHRIGGTTAASRTGGACPAPTGPVRIERRLVQIGNAFPRLPRRFAPRNDTSGQRSNGNGAAHRIGGTTAASRTGGACPAPTGPVRIERRPVRIGSAFPRLPRRFAPRNDTSGQRSNGNGAAHRIGVTTAASRTGGACPAPTGPVRIERRPTYDPFFILQYSLFIISSIPLRGMANHMTKRPEIPCLSCKFPQSRRICH